MYPVGVLFHFMIDITRLHPHFDMCLHVHEKNTLSLS